MPISTLSKLIFVSLAVLAMSSCTTMDSAIKDIKSYGGDSQSKTYYVGKSELPLYSGPSLTTDCIAKLPLNEKVIRYRVKNGFAYVRASITGQKGWVNNGQLKRKPVPVPKQDPTVKPPKKATSVSSESKKRNPSADGKIMIPTNNEDNLSPKKSNKPGDASSFDAF
jgi:uncharacterized protein YgiM (DUF1202 family)